MHLEDNIAKFLHSQLTDDLSTVAITLVTLMLQLFEALDAFLFERLHIILLLRLVLLAYDLVNNWFFIFFPHERVMPGVVFIILYMYIPCFLVQIVVYKALQLKPFSGLSGIPDFLLGQHVQSLQMMVLQDYLGHILQKLHLLEQQFNI